jgi:hypothetical protein
MINGFQKLNDVTDPRNLNKLNNMLQLLFAGGNFSAGVGSPSVSGIPVWTTNQRPAVTTAGAFGYNADFKAIEFYTPNGWFVNGGTWTTALRPSLTGLCLGSWGYNTDIGSREYYDGTTPWNAA